MVPTLGIADSLNTLKKQLVFHSFRCQNLQSQRQLHTFSTLSQRALANGSPETLVLHERGASFGLPGPWNRRQLHGFSTPTLKTKLVFHDFWLSGRPRSLLGAAWHPLGVSGDLLGASRSHLGAS